MALRVRRDGPLPIAEQIAAQLRGLIRAGRLRAGERLPPVRVLAGFLRVNRNTVAKVYATLERDGALVTTQGRGTFVAAVSSRRGGETIGPLIDRLLDEAAAHGIGEAELHALVVGRAAQRARADRPRVGFVECNTSDLAYFSGNWPRGCGFRPFRCCSPICRVRPQRWIWWPPRCFTSKRSAGYCRIMRWWA